jgi:hypothetical protein
MIDKVVIQSSNSGARLTFSDPEFSPDSRLNYFVVTVEDAGLTAASRIYAYMAEGLAELFTDIAENWRGWKGEKKTETIEGDLALTCTSDTLGHTFVKISLSSLKYNWTVQTTLRLDAGQLEEIAKQLNWFFQIKY